MLGGEEPAPRSGVADRWADGVWSSSRRPRQAAPSTAWIGNKFQVDVPNLVRRANIVVGVRAAQPAQLMPLGNGQMGAAVWAAGGFTAQINRTDTWPTRRSPGQVDDPGPRGDDGRERLLRAASTSTTRLYRQSGRRDDRDDLRPRRQGRADRRRHRRRPEHARRPRASTCRTAATPRPARAARSRAWPRRGSTPAAPPAAPARRSAASPRSPRAARTSRHGRRRPHRRGLLQAQRRRHVPRHRRQPDVGRRRRAGDRRAA